MRRKATSGGKASGGNGARRRTQAPANGALSLAELRRRAVQQLRGRAAALEKARREYEAAAEECARLHAGEPTGNGHAPDSERELAAEELRHRLAEEERKGRDASAAAEAERLRRREAEEAREAVSAKLDAARDALSRERSRAERLEAEVAEVRDRAEAREREANAEAASADERLHAEMALMTRKLEECRAENDRLRAEMRGLLEFLDRLSEILSAAAPEEGG